MSKKTIFIVELRTVSAYADGETCNRVLRVPKRGRAVKPFSNVGACRQSPADVGGLKRQ